MKPVADTGEGPRGPPIFRPNWGPKSRKILGGRSKGLDDRYRYLRVWTTATPPPPPCYPFPLFQALDAALETDWLSPSN